MVGRRAEDETGTGVTGEVAPAELDARGIVPGRIDPDTIEWLTFDCYGTLIDWETGIVEALRTLLGPTVDGVNPSDLLEPFGRFEPEIQAGPFLRYRDVLREVARRFGASFGTPLADDAIDRLAASVEDWPAFPDSAAALRVLGGRYRLAVVSNVDDDLFAASRERLGGDFDEVVTAEQVRSYKPGRAHFDELLRRIGVDRSRVLHCAQSLFHDIAPASALGFSTVWVDRRHDRTGAGATPPARARPDATVPDMSTLATVLVPE